MGPGARRPTDPNPVDRRKAVVDKIVRVAELTKMKEKAGPSNADKGEVSSEGGTTATDDLTRRLIAAFGQIEDEALRVQLLALVESVANGQVGEIGFIE